ncbi:PQQ-like beta-propeller repeat protein [Sphingobium sp. UBA5915]|uniref:outer membrane protein assembly factor BamB family protein n=1 Tax=Sphingobium sp. UBA5915 TaxID=1947530 RepID=UPI0025CE76E3|nr:PQQ-like beta-propeller repeat protein [Sphingobium sp. UBA5915]|tara:strand:+ start:505 stop:1866 length:1362 start_codon:yes stop_codon:yes gene_type:complete
MSDKMAMVSMKSLAPMGRAMTVAAMIAMLAGCGIIGGKKGGPKTPVVGNRVSILSNEQGVEVDPALADVPVTLPAPYVNDSWSQPGGNSSKAMGHVSLAGSPSQAWTVSIQGSKPQARLAASPVVSDGKLYVIDAGAHVIAFDAASGSRLWQTSLPAEGNGRALFGGGVSVLGDRLFASTGVGDVVAMEAATGKILWQKHLGGPLRGAPTLENGHVYVMGQDNQIFALNQSDGVTQWTDSGTLQVTGIFGVAAPAAAQGTVIAGYSSGEISAYRYENGRSLWGDALSRTSISTAVATLTDIDADPVIDRGRVFAIGQGGRMASYELTSGQRIWEINIAGISTPAVVGEWVFAVTSDAKLLCVSRATGKIRWISQLRRWVKEKKKDKAIRWTGPVLAGGRLIVVSTRGEMVYVDPASGDVQSTVDMDRSMSLSPVVANNMLYILADDGKLTAFR